MPETPDEATSGNDRGAGAVALSIAGMMLTLGNGEMAALRRLDDDAAYPAYWRLAARHPVLSRARAYWQPIVQALAILTPKGQLGERGDLHDNKRKLGLALCDGGSSDWPGSLAPGASPRPFFSEGRLAQLLAARGEQRVVLLTRAVRALAANRDAGSGLDVGDLAWRFLDPDPEKLAEPYYRRLDRAEQTAKFGKTERTADA